jgi:hypothetical protein
MIDPQSQVSTVAAAVVFSVDKLPELMCGNEYCHNVKTMTKEISEFFGNVQLKKSRIWRSSSGWLF